MSIPPPLGLLSASAAVSKSYWYLLFIYIAMSFEVRGRCETPSYFLSICEFLTLSRSKSALPPSHLGIVQINLPSALGLASVQLVAPRVTCLRCRVVAYRFAITMQRADTAK